MEKISVIIPVYNDEKYLTNCVESVLKQSYSNLEIILVDDGSTDSTPEICEKYSANYANIRVLHKKNGGLGSSRNAGLAMATGDYILFVDSDDWLEDNHIEGLYDLLKKNNADIAVSSFNYFLESQNAIGYFIRKEDYFEKTYTPKEWFLLENEPKYNIGLMFTVAWGKLYKRSLFKNIVYPNRVGAVEDDLTTWKIYLLADKISYMNRPTYFYRKHDGSITAQTARTSSYPIEPVEERISLLSQIGFDVSSEKVDYRSRLNDYLKDDLNDGDYAKYRDAKQKLAILKKYRSI